MENNIERDIHLLESYAGMTHKMTDNQGRPKLDQAIEHVLSDYKRVLKENEELNYKLHSKKIALEIYNRYIPKSKVEEKIEEIQKEYEETLKTANFKEIEKMNKINFRGITLEGQRSILRELLENRR